MKLTKKGMAKGFGFADTLIGLLIGLTFLGALAPSIFLNILNVNTTGGAPSWVQPILLIVVGAGIVYLVWKAVRE